jgi:mRNA interferase MazF
MIVHTKAYNFMRAAMTPFEPVQVVSTITLETDFKPPKVAPRVKSAPKIRQLYWCDFPEDAHLPEFWKRRPVVILSYKNTLHGAVTVIPCSTQNQEGNPWAIELGTTIDGATSWAICDKLTCVAVSRLSSDRGGIRRLPEDEFNGILAAVLRWLPRLPDGP